MAIWLPQPTLAGGSATVDATFTDPAGDATSGAADITTIRLTHTASRVLTFAISLTELPGPERQVDLYFDTDHNEATGDTSPNIGGLEHWIYLDGPTLQTRARRWSGSAWATWTPSTLSGSYRNGVWSVSISVSELNGTQRFRFRISSRRFRDDVDLGVDRAGYFTYDFATQPPPPPPPPPPPSPRLVITSLKQTPSHPAAGERFTVLARIARAGSGGAFRGDGFCSAEIRGRPVKWTGVAGTGRVLCQFEIPASAVGKRITGTIGGSEGSAEVRRRFSARVERPLARLTAVGVATSPSSGPRAGSQFLYALGVGIRLGSQPAARIESGTVSCKATIGRRTLKTIEQRMRPLSGVRCGWEVPYDTSGSTLNGVITVRSKGGLLRHVFKRRVG